MKTITIDSEKCNGCGLCVKVCHEGVIALENGKAVVASMNLCDGIGDCLPACPQNAITFIDTDRPASLMAQDHQWPIQLALVSPPMPVFNKGVLNIAADCTAFVVDDFKRKYVSDMPLVIGCPKLDPMERFEKIERIVSENNIRVINIMRMQIPCCSMMVKIVEDMVKRSGKEVKVNETVFATNGTPVPKGSLAGPGLKVL